MITLNLCKEYLNMVTFNIGVEHFDILNALVINIQRRSRFGPSTLRQWTSNMIIKVIQGQCRKFLDMPFHTMCLAVYIVLTMLLLLCLRKDCKRYSVINQVAPILISAAHSLLPVQSVVICNMAPVSRIVAIITTNEWQSHLMTSMHLITVIKQPSL